MKIRNVPKNELSVGVIESIDSNNYDGDQVHVVRLAAADVFRAVAADNFYESRRR